jgi:PadR family transcriptional regulator PadR
MVSKSDTATAFDTLNSELRRGLVALAVLAECRTPQYGYSLKQSLAEAGLDINEGTLYPLMRRMEDQGLLVSEWQIADEGRPRRYYQLGPEGAQALERLTAEWQTLANAMSDLLKRTQAQDNM